jgi:NDP-sugar pyrophosphorylase family protein
MGEPILKEMKTCKTLILCGGRGTRIGKIGEAMPKALVELHGKPILYHKFLHGIRQGFNRFVLALGYKGDMIVEACRSMDLPCHIEFSDSGESAGMLERIYEARNLLDERVLVTYGDSISNLPFPKLMDFHLEQAGLASVVTAPIQSPFGLVTFDVGKRVLTLDEKPVLYYYIGTFVLDKRALECVPDKTIRMKDGEGLILFFRELTAQGKLHTFVHEGSDITFNTVEELQAAREGFLKFYTHFQ